MLGLMKRSKRRQNLKERVLKNREAVLGAMSNSIKGARQCPMLLGEKCIGPLCEMFIELESRNNETGQVTKFSRCSFVETPLMLIELNNNMRKVVRELQLTQKLFCDLAGGGKKG